MLDIQLNIMLPFGIWIDFELSVIINWNYSLLDDQFDQESVVCVTCAPVNAN